MENRKKENVMKRTPKKITNSTDLPDEDMEFDNGSLNDILTLHKSIEEKVNASC